MDRSHKTAAAIALLVCTAMLAACTAPLSAEETPEQSRFYEEKYSGESAPGPDAARVLEFLDGCVGGQYIYSAQGHPITQELIAEVNRYHENYLTHGRLEYLEEIAQNAEAEGHIYPEDYAWDCSGLWWDCMNTLGFYDGFTDKTAEQTYLECCTPIEKDDLRPGDLVFLDVDGKILHMGIVGQQGYIYEAVGGFAGVVKKRTIDRRIYVDIVRGGVLMYPDWNVFGRPNIYE